MGLGDVFRKMLGGGGGDDAMTGEPVEYQGFTITPAPKRNGGQFLTAGRITKDHAGGERVHEFVRADTHSSLDEARNFSLTKARQIIDQLGDRIFDQRS